MLMMQGLRDTPSFVVKHGVASKVFPFIRTALRDRPDFIHVDWLHQYYLRRQTWMTWLTFLPFVLDIFFAKYVLGVNFVWTLHNIHPHNAPTTGIYEWPRLIFAQQAKWIRVFSAETVTKASVALKVSPLKFKVIPEGSYLGYYSDSVSASTSRERMKIAKDEFVLLFLGSIRPYKGIEELIREYGRAKTENWRLLITGISRDQAYTDTLSGLCADDPSITFAPGMVADEDIQYYMHASNVVVLPFRKVENSGSTILAMGFAKPVIAPAIGVLPYRLRAQPELLFDTDVREVLNRLPSYSKVALADMGKRNKQNLADHTWKDFGVAFQ
ncbi:glycosyltransferase involved in cell wall biosynthesis [Lewinella antarctica]|uniref:Glycosyltransferase involved in cell wall biosynthesis n=2 Tax=Neolewinella antarctica TaxID=442734 RepID=A0ABX0XB01_9BACT|nr:glycosyltransferase involved in cell wall biosynthesis [Neolewinella antarctica]